MIGSLIGAAAPYHNLILAGSVGGRLIPIGQTVAKRIGASFFNLDTELQTREGYSADDIRGLFGAARLKRLESEIIREFALRRGALISVNGTTLLDDENRARLIASGPVLILTCALNEALRRLHVANGARFHDPKVRSAALNLIRRDAPLLQIPDLPRLDTTRLSIEQTADQAISFWRERETVTS